MSRLVISNKKEIRDKITSDSINGGFIVNGEKSIDNIYVNTFSKLNFSSENYYEIGNDYIACAGTLVFKGKVGSACLQEILNSFSGDINEIRKSLIGSYVIVLYKAEKAYIFVDEVGTYAFHYYNNKNVFVASNTYYHIGTALGTKINSIAFKERIVEYCNIDEVSILENVFRLCGDEALFYGQGKWGKKYIGQNNYTFNTDTEEEAVDKMVELLLKYSSQYKMLGDSPVLFTTGGVDSRFILSLYDYLKVKPTIVNWQGAPIDMNTKEEDGEIAEKLADYLKLRYIEYDVSHDYEDDYKIIIDKIKKYGENGLIYCGNSKWYDIFNNPEFRIFDFGYFGETIKGWELLDDNYHKGFCIDDYVNMYLNRQTYKYNDDEFRGYIRQKIIKLAQKYNMDLMDLKKEDCMQLYFEYRIHADTYCSNFANMFGYSVNLLAEKELIDFINSIGYEIKKDDHLNLRLTNCLSSKLLHIPYFTHCKYREFIPDELILVSKEKNRNIKLWLKKGKFGKLIKKVKSLLPLKKDNNKFKKKALDILTNTGFEKMTNMKINKNAFSYDIIMLELPGWAIMLRQIYESQGFKYSQME